MKSRALSSNPPPEGVISKPPPDSNSSNSPASAPGRANPPAAACGNDGAVRHAPAAAVRHVEAREILVRIGRRRVDILLAERVVVAVRHGQRLAVHGSFLQHGNLHRAVPVEIHQRHGARFGQRLAHGGVDDLPHGLLVGELDLGFLRVHVDVDTPGIERQVEEIGGLAALGNQLLVGFQNGARQIGALEKAPVDKKVLLRVAFLGGSRTADISLDAGDRSVGLDLQQVLLDVTPHHVDDASRQRPGLQRIDRSVVGVEFEGDLRVTERDALELGLDLRRRGGALVQKTAARRNVVEKVAHEELRTHGTHHRVLRRELPAVDLGLRTHLVAGLPGAQFDLRHGGDRSQGLAAESERVQGVNILHGPDLARGVAVEGHARVDGRHAAAVVDDLDQVLAAVAEVDLHRSRPGVDGVLHHLLHHRGGPVDDLARGDLVGNDLG